MTTMRPTNKNRVPTKVTSTTGTNTSTRATSSEPSRPKTSGISNPMRQKANVCKMKVTCRQTVVPASRPDHPGSACWVLASHRAATTTARIPEPSNSSATTYIKNGATTISELAATKSRLRRSTVDMPHPASAPISTPIPTAAASIPAASSIVTLPATAATTATRNAVRPVPSLTRLSPSRMETKRRGSATRFAIVLTATASVGETIAPRANATANGIATNRLTTPPTANVAVSTSPIASARTGRLTRRRSR